MRLKSRSYYPLGGFLLSYRSYTAVWQAGNREELRRAGRRAHRTRELFGKAAGRREEYIPAFWDRAQCPREEMTLSFLPSFFFLSFFSLSLHPSSQVVIERTILTVERSRMAHPSWYLTVRRRSVSPASTGRRFAVCGLRASFAGNLDGSFFFPVDVTIPRHAWNEERPIWGFLMSFTDKILSSQLEHEIISQKFIMFKCLKMLRKKSRVFLFKENRKREKEREKIFKSSGSSINDQQRHRHLNKDILVFYPCLFRTV